VLNYQFDWAIITSGQYFEWIVSGIKVTLQLSVVSVALSFILGLLIAVMRMSNLRPVRWFAHGYLEFFRNTPLLQDPPHGGQRLDEHHEF
jgi:polar amino acid transport system permease protein